MGITITFEAEKRINYLVIQQNNMTLYYKDFEALLIVMELSEQIHRDKNHPLTYIMDHLQEETNKDLYHNEIDPSFSDEGHYHFERKDRQDLSIDDIVSLLETLKHFSLLSESEVNFALNEYDTQPSSRALHF